MQVTLAPDKQGVKSINYNLLILQRTDIGIGLFLEKLPNYIG